MSPVASRLMGAALVVVASIGSGSAQASTPASFPHIVRIASANPGSVNAYLVREPAGIVVVDAGRNVTGGRAIVAALRRAGRPVRAVLLTHPHPDHIGGLGVIHSAYPSVPLYASRATAAWMHADPLKFYGLARKADPDFPRTLTYPDHTFGPNATLHLAGATFQTLQLSSGESATATVYREVGRQVLFSGDVTDNRATPALLEGHSCGWLVDLVRLTNVLPGNHQLYPGHGAPAAQSVQVAEQRQYLRFFRAAVRPAVASTSAAGAAVSPRELAAIVSKVNRHFPHYPPVAAEPKLLQLNVLAVGTELTAEGKATLPKPCR